MRLSIILALGTIGLFAIIAWAKTEADTSVAKPVSLYGTYNGGIVPIQVTSDGSLVIQ